VKRIEGEMGIWEGGAGRIGLGRGRGIEDREGEVEVGRGVGVEVEVGVDRIIGIQDLDRGVGRFPGEVPDIGEVKFK
jgi:hypothetical protein